MTVAVTLKNQNREVQGAISIFCFSITGSSEAISSLDLSSYLHGYTVVGSACGATAATDYAEVAVGAKVANGHVTSELSLVVFCLRAGGA